MSDTHRYYDVKCEFDFRHEKTGEMEDGVVEAAHWAPDPESAQLITLNRIRAAYKDVLIKNVSAKVSDRQERR